MPIPIWKKDINTHLRIGRAIRDQRVAGKVTQSYVAKFIGCHGSSISALECGRAASIELIESVVWALGLDLEALHFGKPKDLPVSIRRPRKKRVVKRPVLSFGESRGGLRAVG